MDELFLESLYQVHLSNKPVPHPALICNAINGVLELLFPELSDKKYASYREFQKEYHQLKYDLYTILHTIRFDLEETPEMIEHKFLQTLPKLRSLLMQDAQAILDGDPAAESLREVIRTYPGFFAIAIFRVAHEFYKLKVPLVPRILTEYAHGKTGIDIHPAATIGKRFFIDHGTGVVIGGTCLIGDNVKMYQGITLGALSVSKDLANTKRHPTIEDNVIIYSSATILGGDTIIGHDSIIGGNVWVTKSVPPFTRVYHKAQVMIKNGEQVKL